MTNQNSMPEYVTREVLKEEISASEKRLTAKIVGVEERLTGKIGEEISGVEERLTGKIGEEISGVEKRLTAKIGDEISGVEGRLGAKITGLDVKVGMIEKRLDAKIETTAQSYKDYTDHRFNHLDAKMTKYFELMMQTLTDGNKGINKILSSHEERITVLEGRGPQPSRI
jgi:hypothetical protein